VAILGALFLALIMVADNKIRKTVLIVSIIMIPLFIRLADVHFFERMSTTIFNTEASSEEMKELSSGRIEIWNYGLQMVKDYPFGAGPNGFKHLARFYMPPNILNYESGLNYGIRAAHSSYLQVLIEQGYLGLIIWLAMCFHTFYLLFSTFHEIRKKNLDEFWKYHIFALGVSYCSILIGGLFTSRIYYEFFWWQIALCVVGTTLVKNMLKENKGI
jgi:O-antigen ligase